MIRIAPLLAATALFACTAAAANEIDPTAYPELTPEALLPAILAELRHTLPDIYSVREMRMCPARRLKVKDGRAVDWGTELEFNTKNEAGGYTGIRRYIAVFKNGHVAFGVTQIGFNGRTGLDGILNKIEDKRMATCSAVPDAAIQQILGAGG